MNSYERMEAALNLQECDRRPVFPIHHYASTRVLGEKISNYALHPDVMANCLISAAEYMGYDAVLAGSDVAVEGEACGGICVQPEDAPAYITKPAIQDPEDLDKLRVPDPLHDGRMPIVIEATKMLRREIGDKIYIAATVMGPMNIAGQLRGVTNLMFDIIDDPKYFEKLLDFTLEISLRYAKELVKAGADQIQAGEAACSSNFINPIIYRDIVMPRHKIWVEELKKCGCRSTLIHVCGKIDSILEDLGNTGADCLDIDYMVSMRKARLLSGTAVRGNVDPIGTIMSGTVEQVKNEARAVLEETSDLTGIILGTGCDIPQSAPNENVKALTEAAIQFS